MISKFLKCLMDQYKVAYAATKNSKEGGDKLSSRNLRNVIHVIMLNVVLVCPGYRLLCNPALMYGSSLLGSSPSTENCDIVEFTIKQSHCFRSFLFLQNVYLSMKNKNRKKILAIFLLKDMRWFTQVKL